MTYDDYDDMEMDKDMNAFMQDFDTDIFYQRILRMKTDNTNPEFWN